MPDDCVAKRKRSWKEKTWHSALGFIVISLIQNGILLYAKIAKYLYIIQLVQYIQIDTSMIGYDRIGSSYAG